ncbi:triose-phosphate isomerase [Nitrincola sp. MINF-07-Sa-05]|uniref:triose-phosphate isomerase n=1 Tax=Nitrincola salilacus TaxID=3400273 RepID=UPI0039183DAF
MRKALVAANWKMNGRRSANEQLISALVSGAEQAGAGVVDIVVCPPAVYLADVRQRLAGSLIELGAQNVSSEKADGAYTGECSAQMFQDAGCSWVLIGHSERRARYGETEEVVAAKLLAALDAGLNPVLCVGETLEQRQAGKLVEVVSSQVVSALSTLSVDALSKVVVAYEPVWAIGTGLTASPDQAQEVHAMIRAVVAEFAGKDSAQKMRILYGGSVNATNAESIFAQPDIDGGLVGGASLKAEEFLAICRASADLAAVG